MDGMFGWMFARRGILVEGRLPYWLLSGVSMFIVQVRDAVILLAIISNLGNKCVS